MKAANDRAIARRIAKESMELIDDERLELMELAVSMKGLPSLLSLDYETLQSLETYIGIDECRFDWLLQKPNFIYFLKFPS